MNEQVQELIADFTGAVTIDPSVLVTIARLSTLSIPGVCRMWPATPAHLLGTGATAEGTRVLVEDDQVLVDLYVIVDSGVSMLEVGGAIQAAVTRAIKEMVGMAVREVNVHIEDVEFPCRSMSRGRS